MNDAAPDAPDTDQLVTTNIALVGHLVRESMSRLPGHVHRDDLTSAGMTALVQAARSWDPERGVPFVRYASTRIRGAILDELRGIDWASRSVRRRARPRPLERKAIRTIGSPQTTILRVRYAPTKRVRRPSAGRSIRVAEWKIAIRPNRAAIAIWMRPHVARSPGAAGTRRRRIRTATPSP